jgi:hypothetical protein
MARRAGVLIAVAVLCGFVSAGRAQAPAGAVDVPPNVTRPPAAMIVAPADASASLAAGLKQNGVASLVVTPDPSKPDEARIRQLTEPLMTLRNDARFPTVIVVGYGAAVREAVVAARVTRADGFVAVAAGEATAEISRLIVEVFKAADATAAKEIADFARGVSPLGRRGTRERRPDTPRRSPRTLALGTIGGSLIGIEYGQPQKRGREIWGALVPWNREWMPGADEATALTTNATLFFGDLDIRAGDYTLYVDPRQERVRLVFSNDVGVFHTVYDNQKVFALVDMTLTRVTERVEGLTFAIEPRGSDTGVFTLTWDDRQYSLPFGVRR